MRHLGVLLVLVLGACASQSTEGSSAGPSGAAPDGLESASVDVVFDGDTVELSDGRRVRLVGINTPERDECLYEEARTALSDLVAEGRVGLQQDRTDEDQFGRTLRYLWVDNVLANEVLVERGLAYAQVFGNDDLHAERLADAQRRAEQRELGLWSAEACGEAAAGSDSIEIVDLRANAAGVDDDNLNDEWILIENNGDVDVDLTGWSIRDGSASNRFEFPQGFVLQPGAQVRIRSGCGTANQRDQYWCNDSGVWNNGGDTASVLDPSGNRVDTLAY